MLATCVLKRHVTFEQTWRFYFRVDSDAQVDPDNPVYRSFSVDNPDGAAYTTQTQYEFPDDPFPPAGANLE